MRLVRSLDHIKGSIEDRQSVRIHFTRKQDLHMTQLQLLKLCLLHWRLWST